jgi:hypothetical protein
VVYIAPPGPQDCQILQVSGHQNITKIFLGGAIFGNYFSFENAPLVQS